jgi:hypothetical protein
MIRPPSQQFEYTLVFSGDPALNLPTDAAARDKALEVARETGQWSPILHSGEMPTTFTVRPISGALLDWLISEGRRRDLSTAELNVLSLRVALTKVDGFGDNRVTTESAGHEGEFRIATVNIIDALYAIDGIGRAVVQELGDIVWRRACGGLRPKS